MQAHSNHLLDMLAPEQRSALMRVLEPVSLPLRTVLFEPETSPQYVHFLTAGVACIVLNMAYGGVSEVGLVGREGMPESLHLLGKGLVQTQCFMQTAGSGLRMRFQDFAEHYQRSEATQRVILSFVQYANVVLSQVAGCNRFTR